MPLININTVINSITSDDFPEWTVLLGIAPYDADNLLDESFFYDLEIEEKMNTLPTASLVFVDKTEEDLQDQHIRIYKDGEKRFTGIIKKCSKAYRSNEISCQCLNIAYDLQKITVKGIRDFQEIKSSEIINLWLNPNDPENLTQEGWDKDSETDWILDYDAAIAVNDFNISYRLESGNYLQHINNICILNYWEWWVEEVDSDSALAKRYLKISSHRGKEFPSQTFKLESSAYDAIIDKDKDKLKNTLLISGGSSQVSNTSTTSAGFFHMGDDETPIAMGYVIGSESILKKPVIIGDEELYLESVSGYVTPGTYKIKIDGEELEYDAVVDGEEEGEHKLILVDDQPATQPHEPGTPVLMISLMRAYIPPSVNNGSRKVWIGNELIQYGSLSYWGLENLTRGCNYNDEPTPVYAHGDGTKIFNGENTLKEPNEKSSIGQWEQCDSRLSVTGPISRDGLDKYGTSVLLASQKYEHFGSFQCSLDEIQTLIIGDAFYLQEYGTNEKVIRRCMGLAFKGDVVVISFGLNEDYILNQFDSLNRIDNSTFTNQDLDDDKTVIEVSPDGKSILYLDGNGNERWVTIR